MRKQHCQNCHESFISERTGAGKIQSKLCPDCLEDALFEKSLPHVEIHPGWFRLLGMEPPQPFPASLTELEEERVCQSCGANFNTNPELISDLCFDCLLKSWEALPPGSIEISVSDDLVRLLHAMANTKA